MSTDHILYVQAFLSLFEVQVPIESTNHKVSIILIFHKFVKPTIFHPAESLAIQNRVDDFF